MHGTLPFGAACALRQRTSGCSWPASAGTTQAGQHPFQICATSLNADEALRRTQTMEGCGKRIESLAALSRLPLVHQAAPTGAALLPRQAEDALRDDVPLDLVFRCGSVPEPRHEGGDVLHPLSVSRPPFQTALVEHWDAHYEKHDGNRQRASNCPPPIAGSCRNAEEPEAPPE